MAKICDGVLEQPRESAWGLGNRCTRRKRLSRRRCGAMERCRHRERRTQAPGPDGRRHQASYRQQINESEEYTRPGSFGGPGELPIETYRLPTISRLPEIDVHGGFPAWKARVQAPNAHRHELGALDDRRRRFTSRALDTHFLRLARIRSS